MYRFFREKEVGWHAAGSLMLLYATAGTHGDAERISIQRVFDVDVFLFCFFSPGICPFRVHGMHVILPSYNACKWRLHMLVQNRLFYFAICQ